MSGPKKKADAGFTRKLKMTGNAAIAIHRRFMWYSYNKRDKILIGREKSGLKPGQKLIYFDSKVIF